MKFCASGVLNAVHRPRAAVGREVFRSGRMPVATLVHRRAALEKLVDLLVKRLDNFIAMRHGKCAAGTKVVLYVDNDQCLFGSAHAGSMLHCLHRV